METGLEQVKALPRLLYFGDVPVEATYHGSALLYRLLEDYPKERLIIVEAGLKASTKENRLSGVKYLSRLLSFRFVQNTRFSHYYAFLNLVLANARAWFHLKEARSFGVDAILTVSHGYSWVTATKLASILRLPLHLICHDEWVQIGAMQALKSRTFAAGYDQASSRLCVSSYMAEEYEARYGKCADVLLPCRSKGSKKYDAAPIKRIDDVHALTFVFAGTINSQGVIESLNLLAASLALVQGKLLIFGPLSPQEAKVAGLTAPNIILEGLVPSADLIDRIHDRADALFVPMSFDEADRRNMEMSFPSKLTDYTAAGVPMLIYGPTYCSAVRWAQENSGVAEVVTIEGRESLGIAIARFTKDAGYRLQLANNAVEVGERMFSHKTAQVIFLKYLESGCSV